jgi:aspartate/methionine/tyrosine aminotransferase
LYDKNIFIAPGTIFGSNGEGYIRFSLCVSEDKIKEAISRF